ncbi:MAG: amidohydrolase family protein, partial [Solirubrobacterales bacterium]
MSFATEPILVGGPVPTGDIVIRGARVVDPRTGLDEQRDVVVRDGEVAELAAPGTAGAAGEAVEADGLLLAPAFVDPHVHLRVPGQEHKEELETGTRAAAAGGFSAVLAMPNTDPVIDSGSILGALREGARREARIPVGFLGAITVGQRGESLTAMGEMRELGADRAFVHDPEAGERRVLLVEGQHPSHHLLVLEGLAKHSRAGDRETVVGEAGRSEL